MAEREYQITQESYNKLVAELEEMKSVKRKEVSEKIKVARSFGDLSENSEYDEAMNEQGILEAQIKEKEAFLNHVVVVSEEDITTRVSEIAIKDKVSKKKPKVKKYDEVDIAQMSLFDTVKDDDVLEELKNLDVGNMTPIDALNTIYRLQNKLKNRW